MDPMILAFNGQTTQDIYDGLDSKAARKIPKPLWPIVRRKLDQLNRSATIEDMKAPPNNRLVKFGGGYKIRVNDQYRITFKFDKGNATDVLVSDTH
jgi:proteic killer suppression protein